ncbi:MAG: ribulose-phosphate 3-epimerase [Stappiaceae bacterium]
MPHPASDWIDTLPTDRCIAEFSMWSADLTDQAGQIDLVSPHADILHLDVADGVFAPSFLFFPDLVAQMRALTNLPIHVHLMVDDAILLSQIEQFAEAGSDLISLHVENADHAEEALDLLDKHGIAAGMVLRVETPVERIAPYLNRLRFVTLLGTAIGVKGQGLNAEATNRLRQAAALIKTRSSSTRCVLAADGGIRDNTVPNLINAGAETVVLGSLAFGAADLSERMVWLANLKRG